MHSAYFIKMSTSDLKNENISHGMTSMGRELKSTS